MFFNFRATIDTPLTGRGQTPEVAHRTGKWGKGCGGGVQEKG